MHMTPTPVLPPQLEERAETDAVALTAERYVSQHQPADYRLLVRRDAIRYDRAIGSWFVVVQPDRAGVDGLDYTRRLLAAQADVTKDLPRHLRLVPVLPQGLA